MNHLNYINDYKKELNSVEENHTSNICEFNWDVEKVPIHTQFGEVPNRYAIIRNDTKDVLSVVSPTYEMLYNQQLADMANVFLEMTNKPPKINEFYNGGRIAIEIENDTLYSQSVLAGFDGNYKGHITLINSHDKSCRWMIAVTIFRIKCANSFMAFIGHGLNENSNVAKEFVSGRHSTYDILNFNKAKSTVIDAQTTMKTYLMQMQDLQNQTYKGNPKKTYAALFAPNKKVSYGVKWKDNSKRFVNRADTFDKIYHDRYKKELGNTKYAMFNTITHMVDHECSKKQSENGWHMLGRGNDIKQMGLKHLMS